ncbi:MAG TPA: hypothetical protein VGP36_08070 [Mycobacteriales bacterium]|nr:hypothetical protein [Mycobacteriales bacterium]
MWATIGVILFLGFGVYAFVALTGVRTRLLDRHTERRAEDMYDNYDDRKPARHRPR